MNFLGEPPLCLASRVTLENKTDIDVSHGSVLLFGVLEERSKLSENWRALFASGNTYEVLVGEDLQTAKVPQFTEDWLSLRNQDTLRALIRHMGPTQLYVDITGLPHNIWMPILRVSIELGVETSCLYVEPQSYTYSPKPKPGDFFDLSERIEGFSPIPTFARIISRRPEESILVPLLGFEGIRFRHLIETVEPSERDISPVIGVPGFQLDYPFHAFEGNGPTLRATRSWQRVSFIDASCPFTLFFHLKAIHNRSEGKRIQVATIGTKPHALGAMLYALKNKDVELIYDHPVRKMERTKGISKCHLYHVSKFMENL